MVDEMLTYWKYVPGPKTVGGQVREVERKRRDNYVTLNKRTIMCFCVKVSADDERFLQLHAAK